MKRLSYLSASIGAFKGWLRCPPAEERLSARFVDTLHELSERDVREGALFGGCTPLFVEEWTEVVWQREGAAK